ncbi:MAG: twin-arginine translocase subunit TatC [Sandaracinaceae bacterium]
MAEPKTDDPDDEESDDERPEDDVEMGFFEHLRELRTRLVRAVFGILPFMALAWYFRLEVFAWISIPYRRGHTAPENLDTATLWHWLTTPIPADLNAEAIPPDEMLTATGPMDMFVVYMVMSAIVGLIIASPWVFWQLYGFIAPGLYRREKRYVLPFITSASVLFLSGVYFGYSLVLPLAYQFFLSLNEEAHVHELTTIDKYLPLTAKLLLAFGVTFQVPVVVTLLSFAGIVNWKQLVKFGRWWLVLSTIIGAILTPPDPVSQLMMAVPLNILYWIAVPLAYLFGPKPSDTPPGGLTEDGYER